MKAWEADRELDPDILVSHLEARFPPLAPVHCQKLDEGWDSEAYRVNDRYVFKIAKRKDDAPKLEAEASLLLGLAPRLPLFFRVDPR